MIIQGKSSEVQLPHNMMACPDCKATISKQAKACPKCGRSFTPSSGSIVGRVILWLVILSGLGAIAQRLADR